MDIPDNVVSLLACPSCGAELSSAPMGLSCAGSATHSFGTEAGFLTFAKPPAGKYDPSYAARYAALWAYGYETRHSGLDESLYRTVSSLVAESLAVRPGHLGAPVVVDCGCGVGRSTADCARLAAAGSILGIDGSRAMLELAERVVCGDKPVEVRLEKYGFDRLEIRGRGASNVHLLRADVERLPVATGVADVALSINIVDRLPHGPERALRECHRILRKGGHLVFIDPLNWGEERLWERYGAEGEASIRLLEERGFEVEYWFDQMPYREILDRRGSFQEFTTLVALAKKR